MDVVRSIEAKEVRTVLRVGRIGDRADLEQISPGDRSHRSTDRVDDLHSPILALEGIGWIGDGEVVVSGDGNALNVARGEVRGYRLTSAADRAGCDASYSNRRRFVIETLEG